MALDLCACRPLLNLRWDRRTPCSNTRGPSQGIFCSPATVVGEGEPWSLTHLNLLIGDIIVHHTGGVWPGILGGAGPPAGGEMGS